MITIRPAAQGRAAVRRLLAAGAAFAVVATLVVAGPAPAGAATRDRTEAAAGWLGRQIDPDAHVMVGAFGPDYGLTADVVLALDAAKVGRRQAGRATLALRRHVIGYTGGGDPAEFYAGSFGKLLVVAAAQGADPRAFGRGDRRNLVANLRALECGPARAGCPAGDRGRFSDISAFPPGDFSNTFSQSLALIGLERTTRSGPSAASIRYLRRQQCASGAFPEAISEDGCTPSVDATAFAVQALLAAGGPGARADGRDAARWLKRHQNANGSFTENGTRNSNSTGLAAQALQVAGRFAAAADARAFLRSLQVECGGAPAERGKIRYDRDESADAARATAQAVPGLARVSLADINRAGARRGLPTLACR